MAYFSEGAAVGDRQTLVGLAAEVGLDRSQCADVLAGDRYAADVRRDERQAAELGVTGVPFFVVGGAFGIPGAQDTETILHILHRAWAKAHPPAAVSGEAPSAVGACEGDDCVV